jgi:hypothetical protein
MHTVNLRLCRLSRHGAFHYTADLPAAGSGFPGLDFAPLKSAHFLP